MVKIEKDIKEISKLKGANYGEVTRCIIFHDHILE